VTGAAAPCAEEAGAAIIIFGAAVRPDGTPSRALRLRVDAALRCAARLSQPLFVPTGGVGRHGPAEATVMTALLQAAGVPEAAILPETTGDDTLSSVRACAALLKGRGFRGRVYAATSAYHLARCVALLRIAGLPARPCPRPLVPAARGCGARWYWRLREAAALPVDLALAVLLRLSGRL